MNKIKIYHLLSTLLWFIRQFYTPNPFEVLGEGITVVLNEIPVFLTPNMLNWIAGFTLPPATYLVVGLYYVGGSAPVAGSLLYMLFFCIHTSLLHLMCKAYPAMWLIALIFIVYVGFHIVALMIRRKDFI